jgi:hypothetical protein
MDLAGTWNTTGTPTLIKANVTDTASNAASLLMDLQVGGTSRFEVTKAGAVLAADGTNSAPSHSFISATNLGFFKSSAAGISLGYAGTATLALNGSAAQFRMSNNGSIGWNIGAGADGSADLVIARDTSNTLAQRNGVNAQAFRLYKTYTDASNYERLNVSTDGNAFTGAGVALIQTTAAGTGTERGLFLGGGASGGHLWMTTAGALQFGRTGVNTWWTMSSTGHFLAGADNTYDIGASGTTRPRNVYVGTSLITGSHITMGSTAQLSAAGGAVLLSPADSVWRVSNNAGTAFDRLQFGGGTNAFPALKRNGVGFDVVRADDTAGSFIRVTSVTVANLPAAATAGAGARAFVSDASVPVFGSAVAGGGAVTVPVYSTGAAWNVG